MAGWLRVGECLLACRQASFLIFDFWFGLQDLPAVFSNYFEIGTK
jgi:hypothetical protein